MAIAFDATVGGSAATSAVSLEYADAYFAKRPLSSAWADDDAEVRRTWLVAACDRLEDEKRSFAGLPASLGQRLCQPRFGAYVDCPHTTWALDVNAGRAVAPEYMDAQCELAWYLRGLGADASKLNALAQFKEVDVPGGLRLVMRDDVAKTNDALPLNVRRKLAPLRCQSGNSVERA